jgi:hypothetical protein
MTDAIIIQRLTLIKHVFELGIHQSSLPETVSFTAILTMHDAIDMFMNLAAEKCSIVEKNRSPYLMQYFDLIPKLSLRAPVNKINSRRNSLKHNGILPAKLEVRDTCDITKAFLYDNCETIFNIDFRDMSMNDLIDDVVIKSFLKDAEKKKSVGNYENAAVSIAKAYFHILVNESAKKQNLYEDKNPWYDPRSMLLIKEWRFYTKAMEPMFIGQEELFKESKTNDGYVEITEGVAAISSRYNKYFGFIFESLNLINLGMNYNRHASYNSFMPMVASYNEEDKSYQIGVPPNFNDGITEEKIAFALSFVSEFALKSQA